MDDSEVVLSENASEALLHFGNDSVFWVVLEASTTYPTGAGVTMSDDVGATVFGGTNTSGVVVNVVKRSGGGSVFESDLIIPLYVVIFLLSVVGNSLVLITLAQNKRMRTVTNVYLLNLAVSDLLLGVFCMPFTLVGQVLRNFIFGAAMCKLIPYFQAVSVSVGVWTLVAISLERYFAICRPLKSRRWQTQFHAYKMIAFVWVASLLWNTPILAVSRLQAMREKGRHKCREEWPSKASERAFNIFLDAMLLLVPLVIMTLAYSLIVSKLWKGLRREIRHHSTCRRQQLERTASSATVNEVALPTNNLNGNSTTGTAVVTPLRQHRLLPASAKLTTKCEATRDNSTRRGAKSVKLWLIKGMVQVRLPGGMGGSTSRRPGSLQPGGKTVTIAPLPQASSGAAQYVTPGTPPEASRLVIGTSGNSNGATPCNDIDLGAKLDHLQAGEPISPALPGDPVSSPHTTYTFTRHAIRSNYMDKSIEAKKKVIRMLFVVVAEFFVCWAPLHVLNTWYTFNPEAVYDYVGSTGISLVQLLAYISSCCNPITYCFMNRKFRQSFLGIFDCYRCWGLYCCCCCGVRGSRRESRMGVLQRDGAVLGGMGINNSDASGNDSTMFAGRASTGARSEVVVLEAEDRV